MTGPLGLKAQYRDRRDMLVDSLLSIAHASLEARQSTISLSAFSQHPSLRAGGKLIELRSKNGVRRDEKGFRTNGDKGDGETLLSFVAPQGGMFGMSSSFSSLTRSFLTLVHLQSGFEFISPSSLPPLETARSKRPNNK